MDMIWLYGIECRAKVGVPAAERRRAQKVLVDVGLELDLGPAARADDFRLTADYWAVEKAVRQAVESGERQLLETLADQAASAALKASPAAGAVQILAHKRPAVMPRTRDVVVAIRKIR